MKFFVFTLEVLFNFILLVIQVTFGAVGSLAALVVSVFGLVGGIISIAGCLLVVGFVVAIFSIMLILI